jgi:hypothetical protein
MRAPQRLATALTVMLIAAPTAAAGEEQDFNVWTGQFATIDIDRRDRVFVRLEAQERFTNDADRLGQLLLRPAVGYRISDTVSLVGGYAYVLTNPPGPGEVNEHRIFQELNVRLLKTAGGTTLDSRTRFEQRLFEEDGKAALRLRQFVQLRAPISAKNKAVIYTEPFVALNETPLQRDGLALWRNFAGISVPLNDKIEMVPGYLNQYVFRNGDNRIDHTANINVFMNF